MQRLGKNNEVAENKGFNGSLGLCQNTLDKLPLSNKKLHSE